MSLAGHFEHERPFPFCPSEALPPEDLTNFGYFEYPETLGDEGLLAAMSHWWNIETVNIVSPFGETLLPDEAGAVDPFDTIGGSIIAEDSGVKAYPITAAEPKNRVCFTSVDSLIMLGFSGYSNASETQYNLRFQLAYVDNRWRCYYFFSVSYFEEAIIYNAEAAGSAPAGWTEYDSGLAVVFGKEVSWVAYKSPTSGESSAFLEITPSYFAYPAP